MVLDVTLSMEEIVEEEICHTRKGEKRKIENEMANQGGFNSELREEVASSEKRIRTEISIIDAKLDDLDTKLNDEVSNSDTRVTGES